MGSLRLTSADRDEQGNIRIDPPRTLAELLPAAGPNASPLPARPTLTPRELLIGGGLALVVVAVLVMLLGRSPSAAPSTPSSVSAPTAGPVAPTPSSAPFTVAARALIAFAAPNGGVLGAIESTREMTPTAHYGTDWIQVDAAGSGLIWLRAADAPELRVAGPDLEPTPTPVPPTPLPATPLPPTPEPTCVTVGTAGTMIERCGYESLEQLQAAAQAEWMTKNGAQPATLATVTPYPTIVRSR